jgi:hypothetical protein
MMGFFMRPFIEVDMDIVNQLQNLTTYSFLTEAMHIKHGTDCLTNTLYADTQATWVSQFSLLISNSSLIDLTLETTSSHAKTDDFPYLL